MGWTPESGLHLWSRGLSRRSSGFIIIPDTRKLLHELHFSVQRPHRVLIRANPTEQDRWHRYTYPKLKKKAQEKNWALIFTDEASFRQDSTLHATWSRVGHPPEIPVTGQRKSVKILGAIELRKVRFHYLRDCVFNAETYLAFLQNLARRYQRQGAILIHDNASYHTKPPIMRLSGAALAPETCVRRSPETLSRRSMAVSSNWAGRE